MNLKRVNASFNYVSIMAIAAGIALVRAFFVAGILDLPSFGLYVTIVAAGMFSSSLVSFGVYERTIKAFPRLWVEQRHRGEMIKQADKSSQRLVLRVGLVLILLLACIFVGGLLPLIQKGMLVALVALSSSVAGVYASAIRATGEVDLLARNTLIRALIVLTLGILGAYFSDWQGAILGEVSGAFLGALITRHSVIQQTRLFIKNTVPVSQDDSMKISSDGGLWFFFASLLISIPVYLDRAIVTAVFGDAAVGTYGFLLLLVTGMNTFTGIVAQKVGPQLVKMAHFGDSVTTQLKYIFRWLTLIWLMSIVSTGAVTLALVFGPAQYFFEKFHLNLNLIAATAVLCILQIGVLADFIMISRNQERAIFFAACLYLTAFGAVVLFALLLKLSLVDFIWLLAFAKLFHLAAQVGFIGSIWRAHGK